MLKKLRSNAYTLELPSDLGINLTINVASLTLYRGHDNDHDSGEQVIALPVGRPPANKIIDVIDNPLVSTRQGGFQKFLIR